MVGSPKVAAFCSSMELRTVQVRAQEMLPYRYAVKRGSILHEKNGNLVLKNAAQNAQQGRGKYVAINETAAMGTKRHAS